MAQTLKKLLLVALGASPQKRCYHNNCPRLNLARKFQQPFETVGVASIPLHTTQYTVLNKMNWPADVPHRAHCNNCEKMPRLFS